METMNRENRFGSRWAYPALALILLLLLPALGCTSAQTRSATRSLTSRETHKLIASKAWTEPEEGKEVASEDPSKLEKQGDRMAASGDWAGALFQYNRALALNPGQDKSALRLKVALAYLRGKQWIQAEAAFSVLTKELPKEANVWQGLGMAQLARKEIRGAQKAFSETLKLKPGSWVALQGMGILHNWQGEPGNAIPFFKKAIKVNASIPAIHNNLGISHLMTGQFEEAVACFKKALALNPDYKLATNNLALAYANLDRMDEAQATFERALGTPQARNNMGVIMAWKGDKQAAVQNFQEALKISPTHYSLASHHLSQVNDR